VSPQNVSNSRPGLVSLTWKWMEEPVGAAGRALRTTKLVTCHGEVSMRALQGPSCGGEVGRVKERVLRDRMVLMTVRECMLGLSCWLERGVRGLGMLGDLEVVDLTEVLVYLRVLV